VQNSRGIPNAAHRTFGRFSEVGTEPFLAPGQFPWTALLEQHYPAMRAEAERVLHVRDALPNFQDIAPDQIKLSDDDQWKTFWFVGYDVWDHPNCLRCAATAAVLRAIPGVITGFFSILGPGKRLPPHYGPYRGVLRHHLALIVPEPRKGCGIRVGDQTRHWSEGQSLVFDDTYEHEAWNDTDGERVVLFLDITRPLRPPMHRRIRPRPHVTETSRPPVLLLHFLVGGVACVRSETWKLRSWSACGRAASPPASAMCSESCRRGSSWRTPRS
jgi:aspartyl/asparaginyl beta-hydroxylase (cupin superfamily)